LNGFIEETISGQKVVTAYCREETAVSEFSQMNTKLAKVGLKAQIFTGTMGPVMNLMNNLSFAVVAIGGGWLALAGVTTVGIAVSFINYSRILGRPINELANQFNMIQAAIAGAERVFEIMDTETEYEDVSDEAEIRPIEGEVVFDNVSFEYKAGVPVLKQVSFTAKPGETIALVGPTGSGKTTIVNLLTRFYDVQQGTITIDGTDIRKLDKNGLRRKLGIVLQDAYVFSGTIRENIRYGKLDATDEEVEEAARLANADPFIRKLPQGYETKLAAEGSNLSHGQRQLITIARAILANPSILVLDEATSSIDTRTEMHIQEAMKTLMRDRTSFVIAHRLSTIREADQILVIHRGEIIERGTHDELLAQKGFYYNLYMNQFERAVS
jgi:ATP-binding cassette subfamily B protein